MPYSTRVWWWQGQGGEGVSASSIELAAFNLWSLPRLLVGCCIWERTSAPSALAFL